MITTYLKRAALAVLIATAGSLPASAQQVTRQIQVVTDPGSAPMIFENVQQSWSFSTPTPFWIGVEGEPLDAAMRTALDLPEKQGILVARVSADGPAAKAGLQAGDILLQWCDADKKCQPIESVEHLTKLVQESGAKQPDQTITLEIRRRGKSETVELKPAKRAEADQNFVFQAGNIGANEHAQHQQSAMQQLLKNLEHQRDEARAKLAELSATQVGKSNKKDQANLAGAQNQLAQLEAQVKQAEAQLKQVEVWTKAMSAYGFSIGTPNTANFDVLIPAPGIVTKSFSVTQGNSQIKAVEWPEDLSVTITRRGNKPTEFVIERGEKKWEANSETLKDLPQDIRALVETMTEPQKSRMMRLFQTQGNEAPGRVELRLPEEARPPQMALPIAPPRVVIHATPQLQPMPATQATQKQIEDLQKALEQLRKQVELMEKK